MYFKPKLFFLDICISIYMELELEFLSSIKRPILTYGTKVYMCSLCVFFLKTGIHKLKYKVSMCE